MHIKLRFCTVRFHSMKKKKSKSGSIVSFPLEINSNKAGWINSDSQLKIDGVVVRQYRRQQLSITGPLRTLLPLTTREGEREIDKERCGQETEADDVSDSDTKK